MAHRQVGEVKTEFYISSDSFNKRFNRMVFDQVGLKQSKSYEDIKTDVTAEMLDEIHFMLRTLTSASSSTK